MTNLTGTTERIHALDAVRALAVLAGVVLHGTMSFFLVVPAADVSRSTTLAVVFYVLHIFRMGLFFLIAGFFARHAVIRHGVRNFLKDRAKRLGGPLVGGWVLLAPATVGIVVWGLSRTHPDLVVASDDDGRNGFPLTHLWFLYYLLMLLGLLLVAREVSGWLAKRLGTSGGRIDGLVRAAVTRGLGPFVLAVPIALILDFDADWPVWFGIPTPDIGLAPQPAALVAFGTPCLFGWVLHRQSSLLERLGRLWAANLGAAIALTAGCLFLVGPLPDLAAPTALPGGPGLRHAYAGSYGLALGCWTLGLIGLAVRFASKAHPVRRYLAEASYWIYLAHLPVVFALQVMSMNVPVSWTIKFPAIVAIALALMLASYEWLVRRTFLGELLSGTTVPRRAPECLRNPSTLGSERGSSDVAEAPPVASLAGVTKRYGTTLAVDGVDIQVRHGELLAVLGRNGAGKSTILGLCLGLLEPDAGTVTVLGGSPRDSASRLGVGTMMQEVALSPMLTAREHIVLAASCYRDPLPVDEVLVTIGIERLGPRRYGKLSAGEKRQVQLGAAICGRPRLLFLDEPSVGLDVTAREGMWRTIRELRAGGVAIVLTTHYIEEAEALADRVIVLSRGRVIATGSVPTMRSLVARRQIRCASAVSVESVRLWPGVVAVGREEEILQVTASDAEGVVRRLLAADDGLAQLEVRPASLAEAFTQLTQEVP